MGAFLETGSLHPPLAALRLFPCAIKIPHFRSSHYLPVDLSGNLTGTIEHEFGKDNFSIELNDAENQVTFTGGESYATISAGDGESNTMSLSTATNTKYFESPFQTSTYRMSMGTYVEKA